jgi:hypothetical protein
MRARSGKRETTETSYGVTRLTDLAAREREPIFAEAPACMPVCVCVEGGRKREGRREREWGEGNKARKGEGEQEKEGDRARVEGEIEQN